MIAKVLQQSYSAIASLLIKRELMQLKKNEIELVDILEQYAEWSYMYDTNALEVFMFFSNNFKDIKDIDYLYTLQNKLFVEHTENYIKKLTKGN